MEEQEFINYRIDTKHTYKVYKSSHNGKDFYKVAFEKTNYDKTKQKFYRNIKFVKCEPVEDGEIIRIKKGFEDNYIDPKNKYNDISVICVMEYEKVNGEIQNTKNAYDEFQNNLKENSTVLPF